MWYWLLQVACLIATFSNEINTIKFEKKNCRVWNRIRKMAFTRYVQLKVRSEITRRTLKFPYISCDWSNRLHRNMIDNRKALIKSQAMNAVLLYHEPFNPVYSFQLTKISCLVGKSYVFSVIVKSFCCPVLTNKAKLQSFNNNSLSHIRTHTLEILLFCYANYRHFHSFSVGVLIGVSRLVEQNWR